MSDDLNEMLLDKLKSLSSKPNENLESLRSVVARIHSRAASQDKQIRERTLERLWMKNSGTLSLLMTLLESVRDPIALCSVAGILHECISAKSGKNRSPAVTQLVAMNSSQSLMKLVLQQQVKEAALAEPFLQELLWVLAQVSQKDPKFSVKCRVSGSLRTFHSLVRVQYNSTKLLYPILLVMKSLSKNSATTRVLVKDGVVSTMEKIFVNIGLSPNPKLRLALSVLTYLSKTRLCCTRIVKSGLLNHLFRIFERWDRYDGKIRIKICSHTLVTILHLCSSKLGRKAIRMGSGLQLLHRFSASCPEDKCYDSLLSKVCNIINLCLEKKQMPIEDSTSPSYFRLALPADSDIVSVHTSSSHETSPASDDDSGEEFLEDDDDDDTQDTEEKSSKGLDKSFSFSCPVQRSLEDLKGYSSFFSEFRSGRMSQSSILNCRASVSNESISFEDPPSLVKKPVLERFDSIDGQELSLEEIIEYHGKKLTPESDDAMDKEKCYSSFISPKRFTGGRPESDYIEERLIYRSKFSSEFMVKGLASVAQVSKISSFQKAYCVAASYVNSIIPFEKVAYPDMVGGDSVEYLEPLNVKDRKVCRAKVLNCVERAINPSTLMNEVVYDLDVLMSQCTYFNHSDSAVLPLCNTDEKRLGNLDETKSHLCFESRFESGNLRKAIQIGPTEYDLILMPDVNSTRHHQWFYFEVSNMEAGIPYVFNIINCEKQNSQFNYGMKPLLYSVQEAVLGRPGWVRAGTDICYYRNSYQNPVAGKARSYLTATFTITFRHYYDVCYLAYHYPYTYSQLLAQIWKWSKTVDPTEIYFRAESLCLTLNSNEVPLLTITAPETELNSTMTRETVFLTSRVHPGESNSSWVMQGTLEYLLSSAAAADKLRRMYVFKVVPMLNMEGVINGCHRCGLTDEDLNRRWSRPNQHLHPAIYHTKGLIEYMTRVLKKPPYVFCDYHGHSRRKNVFLYGCSNMDSWNDADRSLPDNPVEYLMLPHLMQHFSPAFALPLCSFRVERGRESTARVTVWREFGIKRSYTMESSFCGCDRGLYQGHHLNTAHLKEVGASFCEALACLHDETSWRLELLQSGNQETNRFDLQQETFTEYTAESSDSDDSESTESNDEYHRL